MLRDLNRDNEALQLANSVETTIDEVAKLIEQRRLAQDVLKALDEDLPFDNYLLELFNIDLDGYALKIRIKGFLTVNLNKINQLRTGLKRDLSILEKISICPYCGGRGEKISRRYVRFDERIEAVTSAKKCDHCNGSGEISFGETVSKVVENARNVVNLFND
jgi:hypothetical protein